MCGIVGLFAKSPELQPELGRHLTAMLVEMTDRGPDSAGVAVYREPVEKGWTKLSLCNGHAEYPWETLSQEFSDDFGREVRHEQRGNHSVFRIHEDFEPIQAWLRHRHPELRIVSAGDSIEIFKEKGLPSDVARNFSLDTLSGTHALGHTRMATESAVTTEHSHPFSTGLDLCLAHNGSLSNHNRLRSYLRRHGIEFQTDNDSEVAAGYLAWRMREGATLDEALQSAMKDLDGFFTFAVGTRDGFAVVRDPIGCKHGVLAETDEWVAMATEYRAIAPLPGADKASIWEPVPGQIYSWSRS